MFGILRKSEADTIKKYNAGERKSPQPFYGECGGGTFCKVFKNCVF